MNVFERVLAIRQIRAFYTGHFTFDGLPEALYFLNRRPGNGTVGVGTHWLQDITEFNAEDVFVLLDGGFVQDEEEGFPADMVSHHEVTDGAGEFLRIALEVLECRVSDFD